MSELCEHETFRDICGTCHRDAQITRLTTENERLKRSRDRYRVAWEEEKRRFTAARAAMEEK
jgi:uncharacterized protein YPO0396